MSRKKTLDDYAAEWQADWRKYGGATLATYVAERAFKLAAAEIAKLKCGPGSADRDTSLRDAGWRKGKAEALKIVRKFFN